MTISASTKSSVSVLPTTSSKRGIFTLYFLTASHATDHNLATTLINEFTCRPHWTKNTRDVFEQSVKNIDPNHLARFKTVRQKFDPKGIFKSIVGEIIGVS